MGCIHSYKIVKCVFMNNVLVIYICVHLVLASAVSWQCCTGVCACLCSRGDQILEVDSVSLRHAALSEAYAILSDCGPGPVSLIISRHPNPKVRECLSLVIEIDPFSLKIFNISLVLCIASIICRTNWTLAGYHSETALGPETSQSMSTKSMVFRAV